MHSSVASIIALFILSTHMCLAGDLNNLIYSLKSENGNAKLTLTNRKNYEAVKLKSVTVVFPMENKEESKRIEIPITQNQLITESITIELGTDSDLAQQLLQAYPNYKMPPFKSANVAENYDCEKHKPNRNKLCEAIGFNIEVNTEGQNGNIERHTPIVAFIEYVQ